MPPKMFRSKDGDSDPQEIIDRHDKETRLRDEEEILAIAKGKGRFELWLAETLIAHGEATRVVAQNMAKFQKKADCALIHAGRIGKFALVGTSWRIPISTAIICYTVIWLVLHFDNTAQQIVKGVSQ